jgi:hypothetical protein
MMRRRQILRRDAERLVKRHIQGRAAADLRAVGHLADFAQDMFCRDGAGTQRAQVLAALVHRGVAAVDEEPSFHDCRDVDFRSRCNARADDVQMHARR